PVMWRTAAYVDINAWSAGIVKRPEDYEWCSFAAAVKGDEKARRGYAFIYGNADGWDVIRDCHERSMREAMSEILAAREAERAEREAKGEPAHSRRTDPPPSKADPGLAMPRKHGVELERGRPEIVERILKLLESGPLRSSAIRKAVGICSGIHLSRYYLTLMMEKGLIKRTDPDHPQSPQQRYRLA
ncbi:MAG: Fic family protein, partial [Acutalibacteraceae bacterium]